MSRLISLLAAARRGAKEGQEQRNATKGEEPVKDDAREGVFLTKSTPPVVLDRFPPRGRVGKT